MSAPLTEKDGAALVVLARAAIEDRTLGSGALAAARRSIELTAALLWPRGIFVTLKSRGPDGRLALRGCIGTVEATDPAHEAVVDAAVQAAFGDPRFAPLTREEYPAIALSVSALTPPEPIDAPDRIVPGEHGVILDHGLGRGVFLPEVALEHRWSRDELLVQVSRKAGLPDDGWQSARLSLFRSQTFGGW